MAKRILSDAEMSALESSSAPAPKKRILSDDEMSGLEAQHASRGKTVYSGPNPELNWQTAKGALEDIVRRTPPGSRTFLPADQGPAPVAGLPPLALPIGGAATAGSLLGKGSEALARLIGASAPARVGASSLVGAAQDDENRLAGATKGALFGLGGEAVAKGAGAIAGAVSRPVKTIKYASNPVAAQDAAKTAVENADDALRASYQAETEAALAGKKYRIDPRKYAGSVPEADEVISSARNERMYGDLPSEIEIDAIKGEGIRRALDSSVRYPSEAAIAITPEIAAKHQTAKALADELRAQRSKFGGADAAKLFGEWSENLGEASRLERSARNAPVSALSRPGTDQTALRMRIDEKLGSNLQDLGEQLRTAEQLRATQGLESLIKGSIGVGKEAFKGGAQGAKSNAAVLLDPLALFLSGKNRTEK
jgi:hypothetical protein